MFKTNYLKIPDGYNNATNYTGSEIEGQIELWKIVFDFMHSKRADLNKFLIPVFRLKDLRIILTGAGSSAFIGETVQGIIQSDTHRITQAIATTDLTTHPGLFFMEDCPTLLISFARSGNSPESKETINLANKYCKKVFHLIITCNSEGKILPEKKAPNYYSLILPEKSNDLALAMTGSFTSMLLSILLISKFNKNSESENAFAYLIGNAKDILTKYSSRLKEISHRKFERVIFLGSGPLLGIARECHLKVQELTNGQVMCQYDSFLGFRHGPRVVANKESLIVYLFSNDNFVFQYERDLVRDIDQDLIPTISLGRKIPGLSNSILEIELENWSSTENIYFLITATLIGQIFGYYSSLELGLDPDSPSLDGKINRVVEGVTVYSFENSDNDIVRLSESFH